ncbi:hypothetical protein SAMN06269185_1058 [Natronoarchaeum philippinense]|uniref:Uncharacterized protein n=1 Tax=Natronoarchaeum philippinense TaxID=558529 RepID=A0A285N9I6_NATPI|nr:hypothetical protein [Natronoarchaeum philippinense]SNZ06125.1 hypothetical protein SAMN06269185_1058 [Natronoarchaeum philippinense]
MKLQKPTVWTVASILTNKKTLVIMMIAAISVTGVTNGFAAALEVYETALMALGGLWVVEQCQQMVADEKKRLGGASAAQQQEDGQS